MNPLISVIVPIYNAEKYLAKCIDSIIAQTYNNLEIILIDDGSDDSSFRICAHYAKLDTRIEVISQANSGVSSARNRGLDNSTGEFIGFLDSDDWIDQDMFEKLYMTILFEGADIAICGYLKEKPDGTVIAKNLACPTSKIHVKDALEMALSADYYQGFMGNKLFASSIFNSPDKIRFSEDIYICEDLLCICKCILKSKSIIFIEDHLYHYIMVDNSAVNQKFSLRKATILDAISQITTLLENIHINLNAYMNSKLINTNLSVMLNMINDNFFNPKIYEKIKIVLRKNLANSLKSNELSNKEKIYIIGISINPFFFARIYVCIRKAMRRS